MREFVARWKDMFIRMGAMPVSFLGVGLYRAWLATFFRYEAFPTIDFFDYALFEGAIGVASFAVVLLSRRITPLWSNNALVTLTAIGMSEALRSAWSRASGCRLPRSNTPASCWRERGWDCSSSCGPNSSDR